jgi:hypothetical protein
MRQENTIVAEKDGLGPRLQSEKVECKIDEPIEGLLSSQKSSNTGTEI